MLNENFPKPDYTVASRAIGFALEQPLHVVALAQRFALRVYRSFRNFKTASVYFTSAQNLFLAALVFGVNIYKSGKLVIIRGLLFTLGGISKDSF
jgi:hypothetical protein